jgi:hypothetical protein
MKRIAICVAGLLICGSAAAQTAYKGVTIEIGALEYTHSIPTTGGPVVVRNTSKKDMRRIWTECAGFDAAGKIAGVSKYPVENVSAGGEAYWNAVFSTDKVVSTKCRVDHIEF